MIFHAKADNCARRFLRSPFDCVYLAASFLKCRIDVHCPYRTVRTPERVFLVKTSASLRRRNRGSNINFTWARLSPTPIETLQVQFRKAVAVSVGHETWYTQASSPSCRHEPIHKYIYRDVTKRSGQTPAQPRERRSPFCSSRWFGWAMGHIFHFLRGRYLDQV